ncbi:TetR/AcrR family transcriptional regulator [Streptomyces sp. NPDC093982]|uniref:TetR/AcrR family transcriptional regulator n=1 Tax=Streptomyces sp. NPDC093982 TaxID=3155077 RepID=UPI0034138FB4
MTKPAAGAPQRRNAQSNRARILETARQELGRNPNVTMEELARAAGVVRRTVFGHFPGREALLEALVDDASHALRAAAGDAEGWDEPAERALARLFLAMWPVGDRYRMLLALTRRHWGVERVAVILAPVRAAATEILIRGQREGVFPSHLPPAALSDGLEALAIALLENANDEVPDDDAVSLVIATLIAAGVPEKRARDVAVDVLSTINAEPGS